MNTFEYVAYIQSRPRPARPIRFWPFASLPSLINTAGFVPVDLADTIFASSPGPDTPAAKAEAGPLPLPERPDHARMMSLHLP